MNPPSLLIVDDELGVRVSLRMVFGKEFRLLEADSIDAALLHVQQEKPEVILLDVLMPKTDGIEVLRRIKAMHPQCEVIVLTALHSKQAAAKALECGAYDFVSKPFDVAELRSKVNQALQKAAQKVLTQR